MNNNGQIQKIASDILSANTTNVFTAKCTACGKSQTQSLSWFQARRFVCPLCDGKLDEAPLHQLTLLAVRQLRSGSGPRQKRAVKVVENKQFDATKTYQLVLQFGGGALPNLDAIITLEDELIQELGDSADVDGHDFGSGEANLFIFTADPVATFERARPVLERRQQLQAVTAACREVESEDYKVIWPEGSRAEFELI